MKGGVAAAVAAALRFIAKSPFAGSISFLITGDEEGPAVNGTVKLLDWALARGELFDHCITTRTTRQSQRLTLASPSPACTKVLGITGLDQLFEFRLTRAFRRDLHHRESSRTSQAVRVKPYESRWPRSSSR